MLKNAPKDYQLDIHDIITTESIITHFQPIISINRQSIVGFEGLCRGYCHLSDNIIPPLDLFKSASKSNLLVELDMLCMRKTLENYKDIYLNNDNSLLFMNYDSATIDLLDFEHNFIRRMVANIGIDPANIVIEFVESKVKDIKVLTRFVEFYRYHGFLIALDDVGAGYSNLDRIALIKPDIIKTDRSIIQDIDSNYYKQEIFRSLVNLAKNIGALILAEGVETEAEVICSLQLGANLLQGFFFGKPCGQVLSIQKDLCNRICMLADNYRKRESQRLIKEKQKNDAYKMVAGKLTQELSHRVTTEFEDYLKDNIDRISFVEALYIIDRQGVQLVDTIINSELNFRVGGLFQPALKGDCHSLKDYYYYLISTGSKIFITDPYISLATGNLCRTISMVFNDRDNREFIFCLDLLA